MSPGSTPVGCSCTRARPISACSVSRVVESVAVGTARPVELAITDGLPQVLVDPDKFTQVVTNLVENAVRHGEGEVRVIVERLARGGRRGGA